MDKDEILLFQKLLKAANAGECPDPDCPICREKRLAIQDAENHLKKQLKKSK